MWGTYEWEGFFHTILLVVWWCYIYFWCFIFPCLFIPSANWVCVAEGCFATDAFLLIRWFCLVLFSTSLAIPLHVIMKSWVTWDLCYAWTRFSLVWLISSSASFLFTSTWFWTTRDSGKVTNSTDYLSSYILGWASF